MLFQFHYQIFPCGFLYKFITVDTCNGKLSCLIPTNCILCEFRSDRSAMSIPDKPFQYREFGTFCCVYKIATCYRLPSCTLQCFLYHLTNTNFCKVSGIFIIGHDLSVSENPILER